MKGEDASRGTRERFAGQIRLRRFRHLEFVSLCSDMPRLMKGFPMLDLLPVRV